MAEEQAQAEKKAQPPKGVPELDQEKEARSRAVFFSDWSQEHVDLIKRTCCPPGIPNDDFAMFIAQCNRSGLDPLKGEADCVPRNVKVKKQKAGPTGGTLNYEEYVTKWCFQPREIGMAARADRFPDFEGIISAAVYEKDQIEIDSSGLVVNHKFNPVGDRGTIKGAYAQVFRRSRRIPVVWILFKDYAKEATESPLWGKIGPTMIEKCARMAGWRRAYPNAFSNMYSAEEAESRVWNDNMLPVETGLHQTVDAAASPATAPVSRTQSVKERVAQKAAAGRQEAGPESPPGGEPQVPDSTLMDFGPDHGKPLAELSDKQLSDALATGEEWLKKNANTAKGANYSKMERAVLAIKLEQAVRAKRAAEAAAVPPPDEPEPGKAPEASGAELPQEPGSDG